MQHVAGTSRFGPRDLTTCSDQPACYRHAAFDQQRHGDGSGMPATGDQAVKEAGSRGFFLGMERLGVKLRGKILDLTCIQCVGLAQKALTH